MESGNNGEYGPQKPGSYWKEEKPKTLQEKEDSKKENFEKYKKIERALYLDIPDPEEESPEEVWEKHSLCHSCIHKSVCRAFQASKRYLVMVDRCLEYIPSELEKEE